MECRSSRRRAPATCPILDDSSLAAIDRPVFTDPHEVVRLTHTIRITPLA